MKKNRMMRLASILLVCVLLSTSVISGTFAKYVSEATATDKARVAKWSFEVGGQDIAASEAIVFDLFKTINDTGNAAKEYDVTAGTADLKIIAPGTAGSFTIEMENTSEVTAKYAVDFTVDNKIGAHILFKVGNGEWKTDLDDIAADDVNTKVGIGGKATVEVQWKWEYENNSDANYDADDTNLGIAATPATLSVTAKITATQVD